MGGTWRRDFDADRLAALETLMWRAYYRKQGGLLFRLLVRAYREQAGVSFVRAVAASLLLARAAIGFARSTDEYDRFEPDIARAYGLLGLESEHAARVARRELRWWVVRREIGLAAGQEAGKAITALYAELYEVPRGSVEQAGALRGQAAEVRDRGATEDPDGPAGAGLTYWPEVARLLRESYQSLRAAVASGSV